MRVHSKVLILSLMATAIWELVMTFPQQNPRQVALADPDYPSDNRCSYTLIPFEQSSCACYLEQGAIALDSCEFAVIDPFDNTQARTGACYEDLDNGSWCDYLTLGCGRVARHNRECTEAGSRTLVKIFTVNEKTPCTGYETRCEDGNLAHWP